MYLDIGTVDIIGNTHLAYEFDKDTKETILVFYRQESNIAKYNLRGKCLMSSGFSDELIDKMRYIVEINSNKIELYINNGDI
ncbi:MAG: hypothetical protein K2P14_10815 [Anaeroplasmataceae bacterium]|nr:hypothetical protein [Anaeroplasmataceae bacterium]